jgi:hypothetical protein
VPELVLVDIDPSLGGLDGDPWVGELLEKSPGLNLGLDFLPGALTFNPVVDRSPDPDWAAAVIWLDGLVTNPDRSPRNPNLLVWHGRPWLIDHGAALYIHHTWRDPEGHARRPHVDRLADHVLLPVASSIAAADERLASLVTATLIEDLVAAVPDDWLAPDPLVGDAAAQRRAYIAYLGRRLMAPRPFVEPVERLRAEVA